MVEEKALEKILQTAVKTGKYVAGLKEVSHSLKGSRLVIYSTALPEKKVSKIIEGCRALSVPFFPYEGSTIRLGRICGKPFRISALAVKSPGEADLTPILESLQETPAS